MPKRKANWWPPSILSDPDVLSVDDEGRFVLCKICHVHYAVHGGKKPKPVIMNSNFRTRAWDVHKERTNSHRLQKQQERLQQAKQQQTTDPQTQPHKQQQIQPVQKAQHQRQALQSLAQGKEQPQDQRPSAPATQSQSMAALASQAQTLAQAPPRQVQQQFQSLAPASRQQQQVQSSPQQALPQSTTGETQALQRRQQQQDQEETTGAGLERLHAAAQNGAIERPTSSANPEATTTVAMTGAGSSMSSNAGPTSNGKRPASAMPVDTPMASRRRVFHAGSPGSSMQLIAESETARRAASEEHSFMQPGNGNAAKEPPPSDQTFALEQADSSARWRHMHDDVSRALNAAPRRRQQGPASYSSGELRAAKTLVQTETGDLGGNNSERVAKKLRSLNAEYRASNMRHADGNFMRHDSVRGEALDRRSAGYKEYWGTLRDVYTSSGGTGSRRKSHRSNPSTACIRGESKETEADSTTPDDSGSSEDAFKPTVIVNNASLVDAIERLTEATTKQLANLYQKQTSSSQETLAGLTSVMKDLRVQHGNAFERIIALQEKHLSVMENILQIKLRKEAARDAQSSRTSSGSSSGSSGGNSTDKASV